jgi:hypothetical protein
MLAGGIIGAANMYAGDAIQACSVNGLTVRGNVQSTCIGRNGIVIGGVVGRAQFEHPDDASTNVDYMITDCAVTGTVFDVTTNNATTNQLYFGGIAGMANAKIENVSVGMFTIVDNVHAGVPLLYAGIFAGQLSGNDTSATGSKWRGVISDDIYASALSADVKLQDAGGNPVFAGNTSLGTSPENWEIDTASLTFFDSTADESLIPTKFASFFKGGDLELEQGETLDLNLQAFAGWAGITGDISWISSNPAAVTVDPATGKNVTITAVAPGTSTLTCTFMLNNKEVKQTLVITVPEAPAYTHFQSFKPVTPDTPVTPSGHHSSSNCNALGVGLLALTGLGYVVKKK